MARYGPNMGANSDIGSLCIVSGMPWRFASTSQLLNMPVMCVHYRASGAPGGVTVCLPVCGACAGRSVIFGR